MAIEDPIGRLARVGNATQLQFEVIGVVGNERHFGIATEATPSFFVSYRQLPVLRDMALIVRSSTPPSAPPSLLASFLGPLASSVTEALGRDRTATAIRDIVRRLDPDMPLFQVRTMAQVVDTSVAAPRSMAWLLSAFAVSALLLAAIGVFGVMSHAVSQRTREIGVRMAIGASPYRMLQSILMEGLTQVGLGLLVGAVLSTPDSPVAVWIALRRVGGEHRAVHDRDRPARDGLVSGVFHSGATGDADRSGRGITSRLMLKRGQSLRFNICHRLK